jgi:hypothetical protein
MLRSLTAEDSEPLQWGMDCLLRDADAGHWHLVALCFDLELYLTALIDRWTLCVTRRPYALGSDLLHVS